jgi:hypothetical protein
VQVPHVAILALALSNWVRDIPLLPGAWKDPEFDERHISGQEIFNPDHPQPRTSQVISSVALAPLTTIPQSHDCHGRQMAAAFWYQGRL